MNNLESLRIPKYVQLMIRLKEQIENGSLKPGDPLPTRERLMREHDLSLSTVTRAISELERQGWLISRQGSGTFVCKKTVISVEDENKDNKKVVGLLLPINLAKSQELVTEIVHEASENNINIITMFSPNDEDEELNCARLLFEYNVDAMVWFPVEPKKHVSVASLFGKNQKPVIIGDKVTENLTPPWYCVRSDYYAGTRMAIQHLLEMGHRRIAFAGPKGNESDFGPKNERWHAYRDVMREMELWNPDELYFSTSVFREWHLHSNQLESYFKSTSAPTAIVGYDDSIALEAVRALKTIGLNVPEDISIIGHGDFSCGHYSSPRLTTVSLSYSEFADEIVKLLRHEFSEEKDTNKIIQREAVISPRLLLRESTGSVDKIVPANT